MIPPGPTLDVMVAKLLGALGTDEHGNPRSFPWYSRDAVNIPEMLAWLKERGWCPELVQYWPGWSWHVDAWQRFEGGKRMARIQDCESIQHALAQLVVAVAEREEARS